MRSDETHGIREKMASLSSLFQLRVGILPNRMRFCSEGGSNPDRFGAGPTGNRPNFRLPSDFGRDRFRHDPRVEVADG
jgi:hypothetical protein